MGDRVYPGGHNGIGYGRWATLSLDERARLLAFVRVKADPKGEHRKLTPAEAFKRLTGR